MQTNSTANNKDGDSCCFKYVAAQRHGSPQREKRCWLSTEAKADFSGLMAESKYSVRRGCGPNSVSKSNIRKESNFISVFPPSAEETPVKATPLPRTEKPGHLCL